MNTDTGMVYQGMEITQALERGEPVVPVSARVAQMVQEGRRVLNRRERRNMQRGGFLSPRIPRAAADK